MEGIVVKTTGSWYTVKCDKGQIVDCKIKGKFRIQGIKSTNPVAVGDVVSFKLQQDGPGIINTIKKRNNYLIRKATKLSKRSHIIAANIDRAYLIATLVHPRTSTGFIDRYLVTAEAYHIPAGVIFNKLDIYTNDKQEQLHELMALYKGIGYYCFAVSAETGEGLQALNHELMNKTNLFSGHSGVGKSALINKIIPGIELKVNEISTYHEKGRHTTTYAEMHAIPGGGYIIDTPGIKEFGLFDFEKSEVCERFPEMRALMYDCQYHNCTHTHEPKCAVKKALEKGRISKSRYKNYLSIIGQDDWQKDYK